MRGCQKTGSHLREAQSSLEMGVWWSQREIPRGKFGFPSCIPQRILTFPQLELPSGEKDIVTCRESHPAGGMWPQSISVCISNVRGALVIRISRTTLGGLHFSVPGLLFPLPSLVLPAILLLISPTGAQVPLITCCEVSG